MSAARVLAASQVAVMLVAASYGIGFLFGSGEAALTERMAGGLYGVATALGMFTLALIARRLWTAGVPVWDLLGAAFGPASHRAAAFLSLLWMAGVLAAQIHGGAAVLVLLSVPSPWHHVLILVLIYGASRLELRLASTVFSACLLLSAFVLGYALWATGGLSTYVRAVPLFVADLGRVDPLRTVAATLAVSVLVCLGADYHQFLVAARDARAARSGCLLAGVALVLLAFLPPAVVIAMQDAGRLGALDDAKQVVPFILSEVARTLGQGVAQVMLAALMAAALGSGAAILRAMTSALASTVPESKFRQHPALGLIALAAGAALAARGQGIVETMVSVNLVYIASVAVPFAVLLTGAAMSPRQTTAVMASGFAVSGAAYGAGWLGWLDGHADLLSLVGGTAVAAAVFACRRHWPHRPTGAPAAR